MTLASSPVQVPSVPLTHSAQHLDSGLIACLSSEYLAKGVFSDDFHVTSMAVTGAGLEARLRMGSFGLSPQDTGGFHLTAPTVFRMAAQLVVIHGHYLAGLAEKSVEVWVKEHYWKHRRPVRSAENLKITMKISDVRRAASKPDFVGLRHEIDIDDGAVQGWTLGYFDLSGHASLAERLIGACSQAPS